MNDLPAVDLVAEVIRLHDQMDRTRCFCGFRYDSYEAWAVTRGRAAHREHVAREVVEALAECAGDIHCGYASKAIRSLQAIRKWLRAESVREMETTS